MSLAFSSTASVATSSTIGMAATAPFMRARERVAPTIIRREK